jgi:predicted RNA polymerase sigma factor
MTDFPNWTGAEAPNIASLPRLTALEAFDAMRAFLESYWEEGGKGEEEIRRLLSALNRDTNIWPDGGPADPAMWSDWLLALGRVKSIDLTEEAAKPVRYAPRPD